MIPYSIEIMDALVVISLNSVPGLLWFYFALNHVQQISKKEFLFPVGKKSSSALVCLLFQGDNLHSCLENKACMISTATNLGTAFYVK